MKLNYSKGLLSLSMLLIFNWFQGNAQKLLSDKGYNEVVSEYLESNKTRYGFKSEDLNELQVTDEVLNKNNDVLYVYLNQSVNSIPLQDAISVVAIKDEKVRYFANKFLPDLRSRVQVGSPSISPENAILNVANYFQLGTAFELELLEDVGFRKQIWKSNISRRDIPVELIYMLKDNELRLSWSVTIYSTISNNWWRVNVDSVTGEILYSYDYILSCNFDVAYNHNSAGLEPNPSVLENTKSSIVRADEAVYRVFALPVESPNHGPRALVSNPESDLASPFGWHDDDGVPGADYTITRGNNVLAQEDISGDNGFGFSPDGGDFLNFDFDLDFNQEPIGYQSAAITNLFYLNNMMHDIYYHHGFDEVSGNFQANNYGRGGEQGDFVFADAQDGSGLNNATFGTPPDGENPVMTMFLWAGPPGERLQVLNSKVSGAYLAAEAQFGEALSPDAIQAQLVVMEDSAESGDSADACNEILNADDLNGRIVLIRRGSCEFGSKVLKAENEGALAVIMVNNNPGAIINMASGAEGAAVSIPSVMVSQEDGESLISAVLSSSEPIIAELSNDGSGPFNLDGDFDNGIIAHEYGHGISNRLVGGPSNVGCLGNIEQMGEGWSDWFGLMVTMKSTDLPEARRGIGTYGLSQPTDGQGIRPAPYSTSFSVNAFTYDDTNNTNLSVPHGVGFVWATTLWDLTWTYIEKYGFSDDFYNGNGGNNKVIELVLEGLKLMPCNPGFIDGRDAILAADQLLTGGENQCRIWEVFARRGLGYNANQGLSVSRVDQVEDFSLPPSDLPSLANCSALSTNEFNFNSVKIFPNPASSYVVVSSNQSFSNVSFKLMDVNGREVLNFTGSLLTEQKIDLSNLEAGLYFLAIKANGLRHTAKIIKT